MKVLIFGLATKEGLEVFHLSSSIYGGCWVEGIIEMLKKEKDFQITLAFLHDNVQGVQRGEKSGIIYYALSGYNGTISDTTKGLKDNIDIMLAEIEPDIVNIIGTERAHTNYILNFPS